MQTMKICSWLIFFTILISGCNKDQQNSEPKLEQETETLSFRLGRYEDFSGAIKFKKPATNEVLYLYPESILYGNHVEAVEMLIDEAGRPGIVLTLDKEGTAIIREVTGKNINQLMAIAIGKQVIFAAKISAPIEQSELFIGGIDSLSKAQRLVDRIKSAIK
jgi:preprotein translocase subunit SecD